MILPRIFFAVIVLAALTFFNQQTPRHMRIALKEMYTRSITGPDVNPRVLEYLSTIIVNPNDDDDGWCAGFVVWVLKQAGLDAGFPDNMWGWNRPGLVNGNPPKRGDVVVSNGHVAFLWKLDKFGNALVFGGNHGGWEEKDGTRHGGGVSFAIIPRHEVQGYIPVPLPADVKEKMIATYGVYYSSSLQPSK